MKSSMRAYLGLTVALLIVGAVSLAAVTTAHNAHAAVTPASKTITGEIVDLSCYMGHGMKGAGHKECAANCINNGGPMGLVTGKGMLYVLTMNHEKVDAFNEAKKHAGDQVKVTGPVTTKAATRALEVNGVVAM
jgi:hypothetical protein